MSVSDDMSGVNPSTGRMPSGLAKTFDNGLRVLELLARNPRGLTSSQVAAELELDRTATYRLLATAAARRFVVVDGLGRHVLGPGVLELSAGVLADLRAAATPHLAMLAEELQATAFLTVADGADGLSVAVSSPSGAPIHVAYRTGFRHPLARGAPGLAILAGRPPEAGELPTVTHARELGFAETHGELQRGAWGIACPVRLPDGIGSVGLAALEPLGLDDVLPAVRRAARAIESVAG